MMYLQVLILVYFFPRQTYQNLNCCPKKRVGDQIFDLDYIGNDAETDTTMFGCLDDCVYSQEGSIKKFCFAKGDFEPECLAENSSRIERAKSNFTIVDGDNGFFCDMEFAYELNQGLQVKSSIHSSCQMTEMKNDPVRFLEEKKFKFTSNSSVEFDCKINIIYTNIGNKSVVLTNDAVKKSLSCNATQEACLTNEGPSHPAKCISTFRYKGREYHGCTDRDQPDGDTRLWCATAINTDLELTPNMWGFCNEKCGYCGGSDVNSSSQNRLLSRPCGYDCLINPYKAMEGSNKEPLIPPSLMTNDQFLRWNILPKGQYRFLFGDPSIVLSCKHTKFVDDKFKGAQTVVATCGPNKQYRFTVKDLEGQVLDSEVKNTRFGCSSCPVGFNYLAGYTIVESYNSLGEYIDIQNEAQCNELCKERGCKTFIYSSSHKKCKLAKNHFTKAQYSNYADYNICTKQLDCCSIVEISSSGATQTFQGARLGTYKKTGDIYNNRDVYKQRSGNKIMYFLGEEEYGWVISSGLSSKGGLRASYDFECPSDAREWEYYFYDQNTWIEDDKVEVACVAVCEQNKKTSTLRAELGEACHCKLDLPFFELHTFCDNPYDHRGSPSLRWGVQFGVFEGNSEPEDYYCISKNTRAGYSTNPCLDNEKYLFNQYAVVKYPERIDTNRWVAMITYDKSGEMYKKKEKYNKNEELDFLSLYEAGIKSDYYYHKRIVDSKNKKTSEEFKLEDRDYAVGGKHGRKFDLSLQELVDEGFLRDCKTKYDTTPNHFTVCGSDVGSEYRLCMTQDNNLFTGSDFTSMDHHKTSDQILIRDGVTNLNLNMEIKLSLDTEGNFKGKILTADQVTKIESIPNHDDPTLGRKCGLSREQFAKGRGAFGDVRYKQTTELRENKQGLAEKHFIVKQNTDDANKMAAVQLSNNRKFPASNSVLKNTVFVVEKVFTNEFRDPNLLTDAEKDKFTDVCKTFGCLLDYSKLEFNIAPGTTPPQFELPGFKGLPSVRTSVVRESPHKRAINSFCIMGTFVDTYQCTKGPSETTFVCAKMEMKNSNGENKEVQCSAVIDDALDSIGHLFGLFCKEKPMAPTD